MRVAILGQSVAFARLVAERCGQNAILEIRIFFQHMILEPVLE